MASETARSIASAWVQTHANLHCLAQAHLVGDQAAPAKLQPLAHPLLLKTAQCEGSTGCKCQAVNGTPLCGWKRARDAVQPAAGAAQTSVSLAHGKANSWRRGNSAAIASIA